MTPFSALDLIDVKRIRVSPDVSTHTCVWCGEAAWSGRFHTQCRNLGCESLVASPMDLMAWKFNDDYELAVRRSAEMLRREAPDPAVVAAMHRSRRQVLDFWIEMCRTQPTAEELNLRAFYKTRGMNLDQSTFAVTVLNQAKIKRLVQLAGRTGGLLPPGWDSNPPPVSLAFCVQTMPHSIDRIVLVQPDGRQTEAVWRYRRGGHTGVIGMMPGEARYLAGSIVQALALQHNLEATGHPQEVAAIFHDGSRDAIEQEWRPDGHSLVATIGSTDDVISTHRWLASFPAAAGLLRAIDAHRIPGMAFKAGRVCSWQTMKVGYMDATIGSHRDHLPTDAVRVIEQTGAQRQDIDMLVRRFEADGRLKIVKALKRLAENRIIAVDRRTTIRESMDHYVMETPSGTNDIANFVLRLRDGVVFDERAGTWFRGQLFCGRSVSEVILASEAFASTASMQSAVRHQMILNGAAVNAQRIATVVHNEVFRNHVLTHLRGIHSDLVCIRGISRLGWSDDRSRFHAPGRVVDLNGHTDVPAVYHPDLPLLRVFGEVPEWSVTCQTDLPQACQDIVAMLLALVVRHHKRCLTRPACVAQSSESSTVLRGVFAAIGQHSVHELSSNLRDTNHSDGIKGYPFLASGYSRQQLNNARAPYMMLADDGYHVTGTIDEAQVLATGQALQFGLMRVVEWCIATGADEFQEAASLDYNTMLMREGQWLMENVCKLQPWEVSAKDSDELEMVLAQIPINQTRHRMSLIDGVTLKVSLSGLTWTAESLHRSLQLVSAEIDPDGSSIVAPAASLLPALAKFYGQEPATNLVITEV